MTSRPVQPAVCPHGCRTPGDCLRYALPEPPPADCLLEQEDPRPGKSTRYSTIVADPPWAYDSWPVNRGSRKGQRDAIPYPTMSIYEIAALPVAELADKDAHLYLWTTQRYLRDAFMVAEAWGFRYSTTLVWAKPPLGIGPGGTFAPSAEFVLFCRRGTLKAKERLDRCWWSWQRTHEHSRKPEAFLDLVERVSPGPRLELFARRQRLGWDTWGDEAFDHVPSDWLKRSIAATPAAFADLNHVGRSEDTA